jgi:hypothetical protein
VTDQSQELRRLETNQIQEFMVIQRSELFACQNREFHDRTLILSNNEKTCHSNRNPYLQAGDVFALIGRKLETIHFFCQTHGNVAKVSRLHISYYLNQQFCIRSEQQTVKTIKDHLLLEAQFISKD